MIQIEHCSSILSTMKTFALVFCFAFVATSSVLSFPVNDVPVEDDEVKYQKSLS